jgi:drug/metabolite transporter (DMT)-like permease
MTEAQRGHIAMLGFAIMVSGSFSLGGMAAPFVDPVALTAVRFAIATLVMVIAAWAAGGVTRSVLSAPWRYFVLAGVFVIYFVSMFEALKTAAPVSIAAVFTLNPALTAVLSYFILRQVTTARMALAIGVGGVGALWVIFRADLTALWAFELGRGEMIYFWGCVAHALYSPLLRKLNRGEPAFAMTAGILLAGTLLLFVWGAPAIMATDWLTLPPIVWITIVYTALIATTLTFLILRYATLRLPSAKVMAYTYIVPSFVIMWELALGQSVPPMMILPGVGLTVLALVMLMKDEEQPATVPG